MRNCYAFSCYSNVQHPKSRTISFTPYRISYKIMKNKLIEDNFKFFAKGHVTRGNLSLQLAMQFVPKQISQVAVRMSDVYATCFATFNEIIFFARRVFKNVSATCNAIFRCETSCKHGVSHEEVFLATCNATPLRCKLQGKLPRVTWPLVLSM